MNFQLEAKWGKSRVSADFQHHLQCLTFLAAKYGEWVSEGCSVTCGTGTEKFNRKCTGYGSCTGLATKTEACNTNKACPTAYPGGKFHFIKQ